MAEEAATMTDDADHTLLTLQRGERGEYRVARSRFRGSVFTKFQIWHPGDNGELKPGKCVTIRDHELPEVIAVLQRIQGKIAGKRTEGTGRKPTHTTRCADDRQQTITTTGRQLTPEELQEIF
jgi:hypothetical protein